MSRRTALALFAMFVVAPAAHAAPPPPLGLSFADPQWTGAAVPPTQLCRKFHGRGATPSLRVSNLPRRTTSIVVAFNDEDLADMNNGGHGALRFPITGGGAAVVLRPVPGETDRLPAWAKTELAHKAADYSGTGGAYLPPCSGGKHHTYSATVKAEDAANQVLARGRIVLGKY